MSARGNWNYILRLIISPTEFVYFLIHILFYDIWHKQIIEI